MHIYDTLTAAVADLEKRGYIYDLDVVEEGVRSKKLDLVIRPESFRIDEFYRFEGMTDPADSSVIYAISTLDGTLKGVLIDAYGVYDNMPPGILEKLKVFHQQSGK